MEYQEILERLKESPVLLIGIGRELQISAKTVGAMPDSVEYAKRLCQIFAKEKTAIQPYQDAYQTIKKLIEQKDYFIVTTNGDTHLEESGFNSRKVFELEGTFVQLYEETPFSDKSAELNSFISRYSGKKLVVLELGIGSRNRMIKEPLMQLVAQNPTMSYITMNLPHEIFILPQISDRSVALAGDIADTLKMLRQ